MRINKFFSLALAAVALASCSDNDLFDGKTVEQQMDPNKLYAQIEDLTDGETGDVTRSGFVYSYQADKPNGQVFVWTADDKVKLYDDNGNWRPQIWSYDEEETLKYNSSEGFAVFTSNSTEDDLADVTQVGDGTVATQYNSAYGVMPFDLAEFANEKRTQIKFNFSKLAYYETGLTDESELVSWSSAKLSKAPIPLWAVAKNNVMNVNYLTGILKVDIDNIENTLGAVDAVANTHQFLIIQAEDAANAGKGFYMHPTSANVAGLAAVNFKPDGKADGTPYVPTVSSNGTGDALTALGTYNLTAAGLNVPADQIVIDLGNCTGRVQVSVPLMPGAQKVKAYVKKDVSVADLTNVDLSGATAVIPAAKEWTVQAGKYYRIQDPGLVQMDDLNNPYSVAQAIINNDPNQTRDWTLRINSDVDVKTGGANADPNNFTIDLGTYQLAHNVYIEFGGAHGFKKNVATDKLVVKMPASKNGKDSLTITNNNQSTVETIEIAADNAGKVTLSGDFKTATKTINILGPNVTLKDVDASDAASVVNAKKPFIINSVDKNIKKVNIATGCTQVTLLNGTIDGITLDATDKIAANVEIYTEGKSTIDAFSYVNMPYTTAGTVDTYTYDINFKSTWTNKAAALAAESFTTITDHDGTALTQNFIVTAAQLAKYGGASAKDVVLLGTFNLNGSDANAWVGVPYTSSKNFTGYDKKAGDNFGTGQAVIKNLYGAQGLFANIVGPQDGNYDIAIEGLKFSGTNTVTANVSTGLGLLAGTIDEDNTYNFTVTLGNITVEGVTITTAAGGKYKNIGGLVGIVSDDVNVKNCNVTASLTAFGNMGGYFGQIAKGTVAFQAATAAGTGATAIDPTANNSYAATNTYNAATATFALNKDATDFSSYYATKGQFAGNIAAGATVSVVLANQPAYTDATVDALAKWVERDADMDPIRRDIVMKQTYFGFSGITGTGTQYIATAEGGWNNVTFYGDQSALNSYYLTRTYEVKPAAPVSPADDGKYFLNYVNK